MHIISIGKPSMLNSYFGKLCVIKIFVSNEHTRMSDIERRGRLSSISSTNYVHIC